jgi:hypothetical protein
MKWDKDRIVQFLRRLHQQGGGMSYSRLARKNQSLLSAAAYHFGSYRKAIERAGIDYSELIQRPRWTRARIIAWIRKSHRQGLDLNWSAVTRRGDELSRAAFAAIQPRLFGSWVRALAAAGLDAAEVARYRNWDRKTILLELRGRARRNKPLSSGAVQKHDPSLHAAAVRYFGDYDAALRSAKLDPDDHRLRRSWTKKEVIAALRKIDRDGMHCSDTQVREHHSTIYGAAVRLFGRFTNARRQAGIRIKKRAEG